LSLGGTAAAAQLAQGTSGEGMRTVSSGNVRARSDDVRGHGALFQDRIFIKQNHQLAMDRKTGTAIALLAMQGFSITEKEERS
jgi:hypothetical protein